MCRVPVSWRATPTARHLTPTPATAVRPAGGLEPANFDPERRPRRQDTPDVLLESGNFYVTRAALVRQWRQLQAGRCAAVQGALGAAFGGERTEAATC